MNKMIIKYYCELCKEEVDSNDITWNVSSNSQKKYYQYADESYNHEICCTCYNKITDLIRDIKLKNE
jgi:hypothetical protein